MRRGEFLPTPTLEKHFGIFNCLIGWPRDGTFKDHFSNPILAEFAAYIANKAGEKMMNEEFGEGS